MSTLLFNIYIDEILDSISSMKLGCNLMNFRSNSQGFADDLVLLAPSSRAMQLMLDEISNRLIKLNLIINLDKTVYVVFKSKQYRHFNFLPILRINDISIELRNNCKYLGIILSDDQCLKLDIERCESSFLKQFHAIYRRFNFSDKQSLMYLIKTHCFSFYGSELWTNLYKCITIFDQLGKHYHNCIKQTLNEPTYERNHVVCKAANMDTFRHFISKKIISFAFNFLNSKSECMVGVKTYFRYFSFFAKEVEHIFAKMYGINNVFDNDLLAVFSRIDYIQDREKLR